MRIFCVFLVLSVSGVIGLVVGFMGEGDKSIWQIIIVFLILLSGALSRLARIFGDVRVIFAIVLLLYGLIGGWNFFDRGAFVDWKNEEYFIIFFSGFFLGAIIGDMFYSGMKTLSKIGFEAADVMVEKEKLFGFWIRSKLADSKSCVPDCHQPVRIPQRMTLISLWIVVIGLVAFLFDFLLIGNVPIFNPESRYNSLPFFRLIYLFGASVSCLWLISAWHWGWKVNASIVFIFLYMVLGVVSLYRTLPIFMLGVLGLAYLEREKLSNVKRSGISKVARYFGLLIIFLTINMVALYRDMNQYGDFYTLYNLVVVKEGLPEYAFPFYPILHNVREGPQIFQQIRDSDFVFGYGRYVAESYSTVLPGSQRSFGDIVNEIINAPTRNTKTPSVVGSSYIVGGWLGVVLVSMFLGFLISIVCRWRKGKLLYGGFFCYYLSSWFLISIHTGGIFQPSFLIVFILLIIMGLYGLFLTSGVSRYGIDHS